MKRKQRREADLRLCFRICKTWFPMTRLKWCSHDAFLVRCRDIYGSVEAGQGNRATFQIISRVLGAVYTVCMSYCPSLSP